MMNMHINLHMLHRLLQQNYHSCGFLLEVLGRPSGLFLPSPLSTIGSMFCDPQADFSAPICFCTYKELNASQDSSETHCSLRWTCPCGQQQPLSGWPHFLVRQPLDLGEFWASEPASHTPILVFLSYTLVQSFVENGDKKQKGRKGTRIQIWF